MQRVSVEEIVSELVVNGGDARSKAISAIQEAKKNHMEAAERLLEECTEALNNAHRFQTDLIQRSLDDGESKVQLDDNVSLLMVHGQDHLMDAMVVRDLATEMVEMYKIIYNPK